MEQRHAVVRASDDATGVTVTVRNQGEGFAVGSDAEYEQRLGDLAATLASVGGVAEVWSAPGRGVRVTLRVPCGPDSAGEQATDQEADRLPLRRIGFAPTRDDDVSDRDRDAVVGAEDGVVRAVQNQIGRVGVVDDLQAGTRRETFQPRPQQRLARDDPGPRSWMHGSRMSAKVRAVVGRTTSFSRGAADAGATGAQEELRTGRAILSGFLAYRMSGLATGLAALVVGRSRYRSRGVATALFAAATIESVWMAHRLWRSGGADLLAARADAAVAVAALGLGRVNIASADRGTFVDWIPWSFAAPSVAGQALTGPRTSPRPSAPPPRSRALRASR